MNTLKNILFTFTCVTTCTLISAAVFITFFYDNLSVDVSLLWQIIGTSALCSLGNLLHIGHEKSKRQLTILTLLHYVYINAVVLTCGILFEWFYVDRMEMVLFMVVSITVIFLFIYTVHYLRSKQDSEKMNQHLQEYLESHNENLPN